MTRRARARASSAHEGCPQGARLGSAVLQDQSEGALGRSLPPGQLHRGCACSVGPAREVQRSGLPRERVTLCAVPVPYGRRITYARTSECRSALFLCWPARTCSQQHTVTTRRTPTRARAARRRATAGSRRVPGPSWVGRPLGSAGHTPRTRRARATMARDGHGLGGEYTVYRTVSRYCRLIG